MFSYFHHVHYLAKFLLEAYKNKLKYFQKLFPSATAIVTFLKLGSSDDDSVSFNADKTMNNVKITVIGAYSTDNVAISSPFGKSSFNNTETEYEKLYCVIVISYIIKVLLRKKQIHKNIEIRGKLKKVPD